MAWNIGSINERALGRLEPLPSGAGEIGSGSYTAWLAEDALRDLNLFLGANISKDNIDDDKVSIITNMTAAYILSRKLDIGVDFNFKVGQFEVNKAEGDRSEAQQIKFFLDSANRSIKLIGRGTRFAIINEV